MIAIEDCLFQYLRSACELFRNRVDLPALLRLADKLRELVPGCFRKDAEDQIDIRQGSGLIDADTEMVIIKITEVDFMLQCHFPEMIHLHTFWDADVERVEEMGIELLKAIGCHLLCQYTGKDIDVMCDLFQPKGSMINRIHAGHYSQQHLRGADIGRSTFTFDVLFTGLQGHTQCTVSIGIDRDTDDPAGDMTFKLIFSSEISSMGPAIAHRDAKSLGGSKYDICSPFSGRCKHHQAHNIGSYSNSSSILMRFLNKLMVICHFAKLVGILDQRTKHIIRENKFIRIATDQFNT